MEVRSFNNPGDAAHALATTAAVGTLRRYSLVKQAQPEWMPSGEDVSKGFGNLLSWWNALPIELQGSLIGAGGGGLFGLLSGLGQDKEDRNIPGSMLTGAVAGGLLGGGAGLAYKNWDVIKDFISAAKGGPITVPKELPPGMQTPKPGSDRIPASGLARYDFRKRDWNTPATAKVEALEKKIPISLEAKIKAIANQEATDRARFEATAPGSTLGDVTGAELGGSAAILGTDLALSAKRQRTRVTRPMMDAGFPLELEDARKGEASTGKIIGQGAKTPVTPTAEEIVAHQASKDRLSTLERLDRSRSARDALWQQHEPRGGSVFNQGPLGGARGGIKKRFPGLPAFMGGPPPLPLFVDAVTKGRSLLTSADNLGKRPPSWDPLRHLGVKTRGLVSGGLALVPHIAHAVMRYNAKTPGLERLQ